MAAADPPLPTASDAAETATPQQAGAEEFSAAERALEALLHEAHLALGDDLPALVAKHARAMGAFDAVLYLADLQQRTLVPFIHDDSATGGTGHTEGTGEPDRAAPVVPLPIDSTLAGRAFQHVQVLTQLLDRGSGEEARYGLAGATRVWLPLLDGTERVGLLAVTLEQRQAANDLAPTDADSTGGGEPVEAGLLESAGPLLRRLQRLASLVAELVMTKSMYGDTMIRLRRSKALDLAAEIQWSLLPPLTFGSADVIVAAGLEPAYRVAGDSVDYAVDAGVARFAVFDGMGHGLASAQLVSLVVNAYRNARRAHRNLPETLRLVDAAVTDIFAGESFCTALLAELDTDTGEFRWVSAGHLEPLLLRDGRLVRSLHTTPVLPLGLTFDLPGFDTAAVVGVEHLEPGDLVLLYTDGVTEARSPSGEFFGVDRLVDLVIRNLAGGLPAPETLRRVTHALLEHQGDVLEDDASLMMVQWRSDTEPRLLPLDGAVARS